jgi:monoamine oxidase
LLLGGVGSALSLPLLSACSSTSHIEVAIVGGGLAGLHAAYRLRQRGLTVSVFEGSPRVGGRMLTDRNTFFAASGQHGELGGEFIDASHATMVDLAAELGLDLYDYTHDDPSLTLRYFFGGADWAEADLIALFAPFAAAIDAARAQATDPSKLPNHTDDNGLGAFDQMSIADFLDQVNRLGGVPPAARTRQPDPVRELIEVAYTSEFGLDADEQSALNLLSLASTAPQTLAPLGDRDPRFHAQVGSDAFTSKLAAALDPAQLALEHRLVRVRSQPDGRYLLTFDRPDGRKDVLADRVVLAIPFSMLRMVDLSSVDLPDVKRRAINELGYGTHGKLLAGFSSRPWRTLGASGASYSDLGYQSSWDPSRLQPGPGGILASSVGGQQGLDLAGGSAAKARDAFLGQIDQVFPGTAATSTGAVARFTWGDYAFNLGSVACYKVGQWTSIAGSEYARVGNLLFCGEHTSVDAPGTMEGAAQTGAMVAQTVGDELGLASMMPALSVPARRIMTRAQRAIRAGRAG